MKQANLIVSSSSLLNKSINLAFFCFHAVVLTPADHENHVDKHGFTVPFVCGARYLGEALRRIEEGASMIRTKGEAGTGNFKYIHIIKYVLISETWCFKTDIIYWLINYDVIVNNSM